MLELEIDQQITATNKETKLYGLKNKIADEIIFYTKILEKALRFWNRFRKKIL